MTRDKIKEGDICTLDESVAYSYNPHKPYEVVVLWHGINSQPLVTKLDEYKPFWTTYSQLIEVKRHIDLSIKALEQQTCDDAISRQAVLEKIHEAPYINDCSNIGMLLEAWINSIPSVKPQYTDAEIQKMQDLEFAEIQKAYEIGKAEKPNKWIPVSERYPEDGQHILFSTKTGCVFEGRYSADTSAHNWLSYKDDTYAWNNVVTAWMPLPEPYKASPTGAEGSDKE